MSVRMAWLLGEFELLDTTREEEEWVLPLVWRDGEEIKKMCN